MSTQLSLREVEHKAFRATYQDGLWDVYFGLIVICMSIFVYRPASGYSPLNILLALSAMAISYAFFWAGKKFITLPRMGQVEFGVRRKRRKLLMVSVLSGVVLVQVVFFLYTLQVWMKPELGAAINRLLPQREIMDLVVASIGALIIGPSMILVAYFRDFLRGYYIAVLIALAAFLMIYLNQPVYPIIIGILIAAPGLVLFLRFLQKYPLQRKETPDA
jgi:hypothetical protein